MPDASRDKRGALCTLSPLSLAHHLPQFWVDLELAMCLQRLVLLQVRPTDLLVQIYLSDLFCLSFQPRHGFAATALLVLGGTLKLMVA